MIIGLLSDTHDRRDSALAGITALRREGAEMLIHCGDVGGEAILDLLAGIPTVFVWGNTDGDRLTLAEYASNLGIDCRGSFADLELDGKRIAVTHGDNGQLMRQALDPASNYQYLFHGHTHVAANQLVGSVRVINPGALYRTNRKSVALIDLSLDVIRLLTINL